MRTIRTISPVDGSLYAERTPANAAAIDAALERARAQLHNWRETPIAARAALLTRFCAEFERQKPYLMEKWNAKIEVKS